MSLTQSRIENGRTVHSQGRPGLANHVLRNTNDECNLNFPTAMLARRLPRSVQPQIVRLLHVSARRTGRAKFDPNAVERAQDEVDVCIVGAGPAGLSAAIRLKQLEQEKGKEIRVVVLEKGPDVGRFSSLKLFCKKL